MTVNKGSRPSELPGNVRERYDEIVEQHISPSRLDIVASCPYKFFGQYIMDLSQVSPLDETLSPLERGTMMHKVASEFFVRVRGREVDDLQSLEELSDARVELQASRVDELHELLKSTLEEERNKLPKGYLYDDVERRMFEDTDDRAGLLRRWLWNEIMHQTKTGFQPILFELPIEHEIALPDGRKEKVKLRIDRVDARIIDGVAEIDVIDYKTSKGGLPSKPAMMRGEATQMPLYLWTIKDWFERRDIAVTLGSANYHTFGKSIHDDENPGRKATIDGEMVNEAIKEIEPLIDTMRQSHLSVSPVKGACRYCHLGEVCRVEQWGKVDRKVENDGDS